MGKKNKARVIMIQGTMSGVGKSLLCAAFCRIIHQDGYRVAPFKSQNMALNSFITADGKEMGRAQVMQAEAAGVEPEVCMNPILLKPTTDLGSQVIVNGHAIGHMKAAEYFAYKKALIPEIKKAYESLEERFDIIVIEGAGSPAELNLKQDDIVNMGMAKMVNAPVLLVGDIDRGGIFAQLIGTAALLEKEEQKRIRGLIVNKFRGDSALFGEGVKILEEKSGIPVLGVVPYLKIDVEEEDSFSARFERKQMNGDNGGRIEIMVIKLPRMSNYTDFDVFCQYDIVNVRFVSDISEWFGKSYPDLLIIPGTKNTMEDGKWLRESGFEQLILEYAAAGRPVFGICGGYQLLGQWISDPYGAECEQGETRMRGLGLLPVSTVFEQEKVTGQCRGRFAQVEGIFAELSGMVYEGYELHMGVTFLTELQRETEEKLSRAENMDSVTIGRNDTVFLEEEGRQQTSLDGWEKRKYPQPGCNRDNIYGTYVHGIFDAGQIALVMITQLYRKKYHRIPEIKHSLSRKQFKEEQYDLLADSVRAQIDMQKVYEILQISS